MTTRHHTDETAERLYQGILDRPLDPIRPLVYADWLDEVGETERAEFIRLQCAIADAQAAGRLMVGSDEERRTKQLRLRLYPDPAEVIRPGWTKHKYAGPGEEPMLIGGRSVMHCDPFCTHDVPSGTVALVFRRGVVGEVRLPRDGVRWWAGESCPCGVSDAVIDRYHLPRHDSACITCNGTGRTPGHGAEVVSRHPVTRVVITSLLRENPRDEAVYYLSSDLPAAVWDRLSSPRSGLTSPQTWRERGFVSYKAWNLDERAVAETALSRALVDLARERAGLPPITWGPSADPVKQNWHSPLRYES